MQGKTLQVTMLLASLALVFVAEYSSAKYNLVGRDDEIADMKFALDKGISCIFRPIEKQVKLNLGLYF